MSYEQQDASLRVIGVSAAIFTFLVAASIGTASWVYYAHYHGTTTVPSAGRNGSFRHGPDVQIGIVTDYNQVMRQADERLHGYAWTDEKAGIARIPIERAMELSAKGVKPAPATKPPGQVP